MVKSLEAHFFDSDIPGNDISFISTQLDKLLIQEINCFPWQNNKAETQVHFAIANSVSHVILKFKVREKTIRAVHTGINSPVYEDSCVEFFIAFDETGYYNFEFNCIGAKLAEFGKGRNDRHFLPLLAIEKIRTETSIKNAADDFFLWDITIMIPFETFVHHQVKDLRNQECRANFYKCGDKLPAPHYISWAPIKSKDPDFHQPQYFGELIFTGKAAVVQ